MNPAIIRAAHAAVSAISSDFELSFDDSEITVQTFYTIDFTDEHVEKGRYKDERATVVRLDSGKWVNAHWNEKKYQYQSGDVTAEYLRHNASVVYVFARDIEALASDIKQYRSAAAALRSAFSKD